MRASSKGSQDELLEQVCEVMGVLPEELEYDLNSAFGKREAKKLMELIERHTERVVSELNAPKRHLKRDDWMSVCGNRNINTGKFVETVEDATCKRCIQLTRSTKMGES